MAQKETRLLAVINQKGGVGKSTTAEALASGLADRGYSVLAVDLDSQANLSYLYGASTDGITVLEVLLKQATASQAVQKRGRVDVIPSHKALSGADIFLNETGKEYRLKESLEELRGNYDFIVIDTPPQLGILTVNALTATSEVVIPTQADILSLQGIEQLSETMGTVRKYCNPGLSINGILLTRFSSRSVLSREVAELAEQLAEKLGTRLYKTTIREAIAVKEAQISQQSLLDYAPRAKVTQDYRAFVGELLETYGD